MGLLGDSWEDPQSQMMMGLAQGLLSARGSAGLSAGLGHMQAVQQNQSKEKLINAQLDNYRSEIETRKLAGVKDARQQAMMESMFGPMGAQPSGAVAPGAAAPAPGSASPVTGAPNPMGGAGGSLIETARALGIPEAAIRTDMVFNGGKGISAMLEKHGSRIMKVANGYAYDENKLNAGFIPSLNTSANGQTSMTRIGPNGLPVISAPEGAVTTFGAYKGIETGLGAAAKVNLRDNPDGTKSPVSELSENPTLQNMLGSKPTAGYASEPQLRATAGGGMGADPAAIQREIKATQNSMLQGNLDAPSRTKLREYLADLQRQAGNPGNSGAPSAAPAYGMTNDQAATADANKATLVDTAKADVMSTQGRQAGIDGALNAFKLVDQALAHPGLSTATGLTGTIDPRNYMPGTDAKNYDALAKQIKGNAFLSAFAQLKGAGAITEQEGDKATSAIARLQQSQSTEEYKVALKDYQAVIGQGLKRMGVDPAKAHGASGGWGDKAAPLPVAAPPTAMKGMVRGGFKFQGGNPADQNNWVKQ